MGFIRFLRSICIDASDDTKREEVTVSLTSLVPSPPSPRPSPADRGGGMMSMFHTPDVTFVRRTPQNDDPVRPAVGLCAKHRQEKERKGRLRHPESPRALTYQEQTGYGYFEERKMVQVRARNDVVRTFDSVRHMTQVYFSGDDASDASSEYDSIVYMYLYERGAVLPPRWPTGLHTLDVRFCMARPERLPRMPESLRSLTLMKCPSMAWLDLPGLCRRCPDLEEVLLYGSCVFSLHPPGTVVTRRPEHANLRILDIDMTSLSLEAHEEQDRQRACVPSSVRLGFHMTPPARGWTLRPDPAYFGQGHNVHLTSVQSDVNLSLDALARTYDDALSVGLERGVDYQGDAWVRRCRSALERGLSFYSVENVLAAILRDGCTNSMHALTIGELLKRVWTVIEMHPEKEQLTRILVDELRAGERWCFTGRFTRVLNTLHPRK